MGEGLLYLSMIKENVVEYSVPRASLKVARLDFFGRIPPKFEHKLRRRE